MDLTFLSAWGIRAVWGVGKLLRLSSHVSLVLLLWGSGVGAVAVAAGFWFAFSNISPFSVSDYGIMSSILYALGVDIVITRVTEFLVAIPALVFSLISLYIFSILISARNSIERVMVAFYNATGATTSESAGG